MTGLPPATADVAELAVLLAGVSLDGAGAVAPTALAGADNADVVVCGANFMDVVQALDRAAPSRPPCAGARQTASRRAL
jgi:hypothetical protein